MKLKYYLNNRIMLIVCAVLLVLISTIVTSQAAYTIENTTVNLPFAYRCQDVVISTNITGTGVTAITAYINSSESVLVASVPTTESESKALAVVAGTHWSGTLTGNANRLRGVREINLKVTQSGITTVTETNTTILFFPDTCTGTGTNFSQQVTCPLGTYTCRLWTGEENLLEMSVHPWTDQWGYIFYFLVLAIICMVVYMKNQQIQQPLIIALVGMALLASTTAVPDSAKQTVVILLGVALGAIFYRLYIKRG